MTLAVKREGKGEVVGQRFGTSVLLPSGARIRIPVGNKNPLRWTTEKEDG